MSQTPDIARSTWTYLLPQIEASRQLTRLLIQNFPADKLDVRPVAHGDTFADMLWYLASVYHVFLDGVCEGQFQDLPAMPEAKTTASFLAWDDERFGATLEKLRALSGEDLLKPVTFAGLTQSTLEFMSSFQGNVYQHVGQLVAFLSVVMPDQAVASPLVPDRVVDELSDDELGAVAGGVTTTTSNYNGIQVTGTYHTATAQQLGWLPPPQVQAGLGALLGSQASGYGAVGMSGAAGVLLTIFGVGVASNAAALMGAGIAGMTAARAVGMALGILKI